MVSGNINTNHYWETRFSRPAISILLIISEEHTGVGAHRWLEVIFILNINLTLRVPWREELPWL